VCEQLAQGCYLKAERPGVESAIFSVVSPMLCSLRHQASGCQPNAPILLFFSDMDIYAFGALTLLVERQ